jgi:hypothetical protein
VPDYPSHTGTRVHTHTHTYMHTHTHTHTHILSLYVCGWAWTLATLILLVVRVPVLSEQMTVVAPSVSTDGNDRTIAFFLAIFIVPACVTHRYSQYSRTDNEG